MRILSIRRADLSLAGIFSLLFAFPQPLGASFAQRAHGFLRESRKRAEGISFVRDIEDGGCAGCVVRSLSRVIPRVRARLSTLRRHGIVYADAESEGGRP